MEGRQATNFKLNFESVELLSQLVELFGQSFLLAADDARLLPVEGHTVVGGILLQGTFLR